MSVHQALEYLDNLEGSSDGYSRDESSGDDFVSTTKLVLVSPKDKDRETDEDSANEDDPSCWSWSKFKDIKRKYYFNDAAFS